MKEWRECSGWWDAAVLGSAFVIGGLLAVVAVKISAPEAPFIALTIIGFLGAVTGLGFLGSADGARPRHSFSADNTLAVISKASGAIVAAGCRNVHLRPLPFRTRHRVVRYPGVLRFFCPLQPMTENPKVVPLEVRITAELPPHDHTAEWLPAYLENPNQFEMEFRRSAFEALQHRLPRDIANRLNPYDARTRAELAGFIANELGPRLSIPLVVNNVSLGINFH